VRREQSPVDEARLERSEAGVAVSEGWFVANVREAAWVTNEAFGAACIFEGDEAAFSELRFTLAVLGPGQPSCLCHRERNQEDFGHVWHVFGGRESRATRVVH
jgi:hypothetical protein